MNSVFRCHLSSSDNASFQNLIDNYKEGESPTVKKENLKKIHKLVRKAFMEVPSSQFGKAAQEVRDLFKQKNISFNIEKIMKIMSDKCNWDQMIEDMMKGVEKATSTISMRGLELICCSIDLPTEVCKLIIYEMALRDKVIESLHCPLPPSNCS